MTPDLAAYLERIGYRGTPGPDLATLRSLHRAHFLHVPFENLDIARGVPLVVDVRANLAKVVTRGRGGFCLELSGLFAWALRSLGFRVDVLGGRVMAADGSLSPPLTHMALLVHLDEDWLADVGFGGRIAGPLRLGDRQPQVYGARSCVVANDGDHWFVTCTDPWLAPGAARTYVLTLTPREPAEFAEPCRWLQTSPESSFTRGDLCTIGLEDGRLTYSDGLLITTDGHGRTEVVVPERDLERVLRERFGIARL